MIVNPDKFQAIFVRKNYRIKDSYALNIINQTINPENRIKLLGIEIDITLSFDQKILIFTKKQALKCDWKNLEVDGLYGRRSVSSYLILILVFLHGITVFQNH